MAALIGFARSEVLFTLARPTIAAVMPETEPVKVGEAIGAFKFTSVMSAFKARSVEFAFKLTEVFVAFKSSAVWMAVLIGLARSDVLSTFPKPTLVALIPEAIFAFVITPTAISGLAAVPVKSPDSLIFPLIKEVASTVLAAST